MSVTRVLTPESWEININRYHTSPRIVQEKLVDVLRYLPFIAGTPVRFIHGEEDADRFLEMLKELYGSVAPVDEIRKLARQAHSLYEQTILRRDPKLLEKALEKTIEMYRLLTEGYRRLREALTVIL